MLAKKEDYKIKIGSLNFDTPFNLFLKNVCHETLDSMIMHKNLNIVIKNQESKSSIILFKTKIVKSDIIDSVDFIKDKAKLSSVFILEMKQIYDIDFEIKDNIYNLNIITIDVNPTNYSSLIYPTFQIKFENINEGKIFRYFLEKNKNIYWQEFFENSNMILSPNYYQYHFFLTKVNSRGDEDSRVILLSERYLLNIEYQIIINKKAENLADKFDLKYSKPKWAIYFEALEEIQLIGKNKKKKLEHPMIRLKYNTKKNKELAKKQKMEYKNKNSVDFIFIKEKICRFFIYQIKRLFYEITKNNNIKITENL